MREQAGQLREPALAAVCASWMADGARTLAFSSAVATFLSLVGAFGTQSVPVLPRTLSFLVIGGGAALLISPCISISARVRSLAARPVLRRVAIGLAAALLTTVWSWLSIGLLFMGGPKLGQLGSFIGYSFLMSAVMSVLSWLVFRPRIQVVAPPPPAAPKFLERLPVRLRGGEIYAVEAEDHYLRLHTSKGSDLILMRLSDAIAELDGIDGAQTHRSWWVAKDGLADVKVGDGRAVLTLKSGAEAPVSRTYARGLREAGWY